MARGGAFEPTMRWPACSQNGQQNGAEPPHTHRAQPVPGIGSKHKPTADTLTMSGEQRGANAVEPQSKRQKLGGDGEIIAFGGPMYDEATARKILKEAVLVDADWPGYGDGDEPVIGFDPDDAALDNLYIVKNDFFGGAEITPMIYFAQKGDRKMCRYLISRGASPTKTWREEDDFLGPMFVAVYEDNLDICRLLYVNGAQNDVRKAEDDGWTPFHYAAAVTSPASRDEMVRWLTLHGALCANGNSEEIEKDLIYLDDFDPDSKPVISRSYERLVEWAKGVTQTHSAFVNFLLGTPPPAPGKDRSCILQCLSGHPGIRKHIGDFVGLEVTKGKHLRILRNVVDVLPSFIKN